MSAHNYPSRSSTSSSNSNISPSQSQTAVSSKKPLSRPRPRNFLRPHILRLVTMPSNTLAQRPNITICTQGSQGDVPNAVRSLLLSTKHLQEVLKLWSTGHATEGEVSDTYVNIVSNFNNTIHAFASHQISLSDIHPVPTELRVVLEQCLGEDPSPAILDQYMPEVRQILYKLLKGLQMRQDTWRTSGGRMP